MTEEGKAAAKAAEMESEKLELEGLEVVAMVGAMGEAARVAARAAAARAPG